MVPSYLSTHYTLQCQDTCRKDLEEPRVGDKAQGEFSTKRAWLRSWMACRRLRRMTGPTWRGHVLESVERVIRRSLLSAIHEQSQARIVEALRSMPRSTPPRGWLGMWDIDRSFQHVKLIESCRWWRKLVACLTQTSRVSPSELKSSHPKFDRKPCTSPKSVGCCPRRLARRPGMRSSMLLFLPALQQRPGHSFSAMAVPATLSLWSAELNLLSLVEVGEVQWWVWPKRLKQGRNKAHTPMEVLSTASLHAPAAMGVFLNRKQERQPQLRAQNPLHAILRWLSFRFCHVLIMILVQCKSSAPQHRRPLESEMTNSCYVQQLE